MEIKSEKKTLKFLLVFGVIILLCGGYFVWRVLYQPNVFLKQPGSHKTYLYIPSNCNADCLKNIVLEKATIKDEIFFRWVINLKSKIGKIYPGKYLLQDGMGNKAFIDLLRPGNRVQVRLTLKFFRKTDDLAEFVANQMETKYEDLIMLLNDNEYLKQYGFNKNTVIAMFIPNTYYFNWNTTAEQFIKRMHKEYKDFWTASRLSQAKNLGLSPIEVITLASIVDRETNCIGEKPRIAGVYLNRLHQGIPLQADPTVVYAVNDFTIKRIRKGHLKMDSPYNTYLYMGLPPGPICTPEVSSINSVLKAEKHKYMYFCAKEDFSGYHNFAETFDQHLEFARKFQKALNENEIE